MKIKKLCELLVPGQGIMIVEGLDKKHDALRCVEHCPDCATEFHGEEKVGQIAVMGDYLVVVPKDVDFRFDGSEYDCRRSHDYFDDEDFDDVDWDDDDYRDYVDRLIDR